MIWEFIILMSCLVGAVILALIGTIIFEIENAYILDQY